MSTQYENAILTVYGILEKRNFRVNLSFHHIFVCGGEVDITKPVPPSFRDRFLSHTAQKHDDIHHSIVLAEHFKDYFKENAYPDLFIFENEIASIASLIMIFLESPGALVELGMFCTIPELYKKMIIIAPEKEVHSEDSFIYLGPLENIKRKEPRSVLIYPWPDRNQHEYNEEHLEDICETILDKWSSSPKTVQFISSEPGHIAFLIAEIVRTAYPITVSEIELAILAVDLDIPDSLIHRLIYLLERLGIIKKYQYGGYIFFYTSAKNVPFLNFGAGKKFEVVKASMKLRQTYLLNDDTASKKRKRALEQIKNMELG